jgi:hypothetical protein
VDRGRAPTYSQEDKRGGAPWRSSSNERSWRQPSWSGSKSGAKSDYWFLLDRIRRRVGEQALTGRKEETGGGSPDQPGYRGRVGHYGRAGSDQDR